MEKLIIVAAEDDLRRMLEDVMGTTLKTTVPELIRRATRKPWLTKDDVLHLTGWSERTLAYLRAERRLAFSQHGRKILYDAKSLEDLLDSGYVPPKCTRS